jgi:NitT/TauT family transport system permease protein
MSAVRTSEAPGAARPQAAGVRHAVAEAERRANRRRLLVRASWLALLAMLIAAWAAAADCCVDPFWISTPKLVGARVLDWITSGLIWRHLAATVGEASAGFLVGAATSLLLGLVLGTAPLAYQILGPFLNAAYALPKITLGPLLILYFGLGFEMKFVLAAIITFFLVFFNTVEAIRIIDPDLIAVVRISGASRFQLVRTTLLPAALSGILTGMKLAVPYALQGAVFGEILASNVGLGFLLQKSAGTFDVTGVFAALIVITALAVVVNEALSWMERVTQRWRVS